MGLNHIREETIEKEYLKKILNYDSETGIFKWKVTKGSNAYTDARAGTLHHGGYINIRIDGIDYPAHNLAWFYMYGEWAIIDHKDRNKTHNAIDNLRPATQADNNCNKGVYSNNRLQIKGVRQTSSGRFEARITKDGITRQLGTFDTTEEASEAYEEAAMKLFGEFYAE